MNKRPLGGGLSTPRALKVKLTKKKKTIKHIFGARMREAAYISFGSRILPAPLGL